MYMHVCVPHIVATYSSHGYYSRAVFILLRAPNCAATTGEQQLFEGSVYSRVASIQRNTVDNHADLFYTMQCFVLHHAMLTCIVAFSMESNFGPSILGTLDTISISNRPTVLFGGILPAWEREG